MTGPEFVEHKGAVSREDLEDHYALSKSMAGFNSYSNVWERGKRAQNAPFLSVVCCAACQAPQARLVALLFSRRTNRKQRLRYPLN